MDSLAGNWILQRKGSDYVPGVETLPGVPYSTRMVNESTILRIEQVVKPNEEIHVTFIQNGKPSTTCFVLGQINFEKVDSTGVIIGVVVQAEDNFKECSLLRLGPTKGQKSLEHFKLHSRGDEIRVEIDHILEDGETLKLVKRLRRAANSTPLQVLRFGGARLINNWVQPNSHASSSLRKTTALLKDIIDMDLSGRRFNGTVSHEDSVQMFVIEVTYSDRKWEVFYRYREFDALRQFLQISLNGMNNYKSPPMFPPKSFGKLSGKNLEKRKLELNAYLNFFLESGGFNMSNIVDALSSFLQIPEHLPEMIASVPQAQAALRRQLIVSTPSFDSQPDLVPRHVIQEVLVRGLRVIKYCRGFMCDPHVCVLRVNSNDLSVIYMCHESDSSNRGGDQVPNDAKPIHLRYVSEIRRGTSIDPQNPGLCGTALLRKYCEPIHYAYCISFIMGERTYDFRLLNRDDFNKLVPSLLDYFKSFKANSNLNVAPISDQENI